MFDYQCNNVVCDEGHIEEKDGRKNEDFGKRKALINIAEVRHICIVKLVYCYLVELC